MTLRELLIASGVLVSLIMVPFITGLYLGGYMGTQETEKNFCWLVKDQVKFTFICDKWNKQ